MIKLLNKPLHRTQIYELDNLIGENGTRVLFGLINGVPTALFNVPEFIYLGDMMPTISDMIAIKNQDILYESYSFTPVDASHQLLLDTLNHITSTLDEDTILRLHLNQRRALGNSFLRELLKQDDLYEVVLNNDKLGDIIIYTDPSLKVDSVEYRRTMVS